LIVGLKSFEAGKKRLTGDIARQASMSEVKHLHKEVVVELAFGLRLLKKCVIEDGETKKEVSRP
jgi:transposase